MENASKALIMAAGVLIAVLVMSIGVYLYNTFSEFGATKTKNLYEHQLTEFNSQFTKYEGMEDITIYDIISVANYANNYNDSLPTQEDKDSLGITVKIGTIDIGAMSVSDKNNLIETNLRTNPIPTYIVEPGNIKYSEVTGRVKSIKFTKK